MSVRKIIRNRLLTVFGVISVLVIAVGLVLPLDLDLNLNALGGPISDAASTALEQSVTSGCKQGVFRTVRQNSGTVGIENLAIGGMTRYGLVFNTVVWWAVQGSNLRPPD